jgi:hypothetical protein
MRPALKGFIDDREASYIRLLLESADPRGKENGLERLCKLNRRGLFVQAPHSIRQILTALLYHNDPHVRRWTLNAIALSGSKSDHLRPVLDEVNRERDNEDIIGAAVAALVSLTKPEDLFDLLRSIDVPLNGVTLLAAAQQTDIFLPRLATNRVNIDRASEAELRLAAVLLGLDKAPEHLFDISHANRAIIGSLNRHPDPLVAQYSVWAICENQLLSVSDLGVPLKEIEDLPDNVRGYVFRLISVDAETAEAHREYLSVGSEDPSQKARQGLAAGLHHAYFDGLEELTTDWLGGETCEDVKDHLYDHMATYAHRCPAYRQAVITKYTLAGTGSLARRRLEAAAATTQLYGDLKRISIRGDTASLFEDEGPLLGGITVNQFNASIVNIGAITGDNATIHNAIGSAQNNAQGAAELFKLLAELMSKSSETGRELSYGKELIANAEKPPSKSTVEKVVKWMKGVKDSTSYAITAGHNFHLIYDKLHAILPHLN